MNYDDIHRSHRDALITEHADFLRDKTFLEFGVYHGTSMQMWYDLYKKNNLPTKFFGFDSFQGLPPETEDKNSFWGTGAYSTNGVIPEHLSSNSDITLVTGFYDKSLDESVAKLLEGTKVGLVHVDCDTYSSTKTVWEWLIKYSLLAKGAIIVYDDWGAWRQANCEEFNVGEPRAHKEIEGKHGVNFTDLGGYVIDPTFFEIKFYQYE